MIFDWNGSLGSNAEKSWMINIAENSEKPCHRLTLSKNFFRIVTLELKTKVLKNQPDKKINNNQNNFNTV